MRLGRRGLWFEGSGAQQEHVDGDDRQLENYVGRGQESDQKVGDAGIDSRDSGIREWFQVMLAPELRARLRRGRAELLDRGDFTETDTRGLLISPFLEALGYDGLHRKSEPHDRGNTPDEVAYSRPPGQSAQRHARVILEAKSLGTDFDSGPSRSETPERQLKRYLQNHIASGPNTFGVLTDGERYRVFRRTGHLTDIRYFGEFNILDEPPTDQVDVIERLRGLLGRDALASLSETVPESIIAARGLVGVIADAGVNSDWLLNKLVTSSETCQSISFESLSGLARDACLNDWRRADWRRGPAIETTQSDFEGTRLVTAVVDFNPHSVASSEGITRRDVAIAANVFARQAITRTAVVIARQANSSGDIDKARVAVHYQGRTTMTYEFDPHNPPVSVLKSLERVITILRRPKAVLPQRLIDSVAAKTIRKEFYLSVAQWLQQKQRRRGKRYRQSILRHLIRTVFAWILKEDNILPSEPFEDSFARRHGIVDSYHDTLMYLFYERLNVPEIDRLSHHAEGVDKVLRAIPFLNGSLFAVHDGDSDLALTFEDYFGVDPDSPGLFTILSRYEWTTDEHTPGESDQTIDPEMLSNLFENLFVAIESDETLTKMPKGTYYTPSDVVMEMVKDSLVAAVRFNMPDTSLRKNELMALFDDVEHGQLRLSSMEANQIIETLLGLTVFDPSVGSGAFLLTFTYAIRNAVRKLDAFADDPTRRVIQNQVHALDINPMAVQVARLRLFIAIMASERGNPNLKPLPNLEGRIVCADSLSTFAIPGWHAEMTDDLAGTSPEMLDALKDRAGVMEAWRNAHTESEKASVRAQDETVRNRILAELRSNGNQDHPHLGSFARHQLLSTDTEPVSTDARLLFYQPGWTGFDIVIGNPPYEVIAKDRAASERRAIKTRLRDSLQYRTTSGGNLYNLFCEVALTLVKPTDGVVTFIVPLSLAFGKAQYETRLAFERASKLIWLRHHDVRPGKVFHDSPVANPESRQRATIITCVTGGGKAKIRTTGTSKWLSAEREEFLSNRKYADVPKPGNCVHTNIAMQWGRVPSEDIGRLITCMLEQRAVVGDLLTVSGDYSIGLPQTAYDFVTALPGGVLNRREMLVRVDSCEDMELVLAILNNHISYMWWRIWGDAFDVNEFELTSVPIPDAWLDRAETFQRARTLGRHLVDEVKPQHIRITKSGTKGREFENVNFYEACPNIVARLDELYLDALGLLEDDLLTQLRKLRSSSNWRLDSV